MRFESRTLVVPTSAGEGAAIQFERFTDKCVLVAGTFTATIRIQGSIDGTNFADLTADITAAGAVEIPHTVKYIRVRTIAWTSAPAVSIAGHDTRAI